MCSMRLKGLQVLKRVMGWQRAEVYFFNTVYYHVTKGCADVAKDMIFIGGEAV